MALSLNSTSLFLLQLKFYRHLKRINKACYHISKLLSAEVYKTEQGEKKKKILFERNDTTNPQWPCKTTVRKCIFTPLQLNDMYQQG